MEVSQEGFQTVDEFREKGEDAQMTLFNLQDLAVRETDSISKLKNDLTNAKEMYDSVFKNDAVYTQKEEQVKEQAQALKSVRAEIDKRGDVKNLKEKVKELKREIKEKQDTVSDIAVEVLRRGKTEFELNNEKFTITTIAKLVKVK